MTALWHRQITRPHRTRLHRHRRRARQTQRHRRPRQRPRTRRRRSRRRHLHPLSRRNARLRRRHQLLPLDVRNDAEGYEFARTGAGLEPYCGEVFVANRQLKAAGSFDRLLHCNETGDALIGDIKTGSKDDPEYAAKYGALAWSMQLAIYATALPYDNGWLRWDEWDLPSPPPCAESSSTSHDQPATATSSTSTSRKDCKRSNSPPTSATRVHPHPSSASEEQHEPRRLRRGRGPATGVLRTLSRRLTQTDPPTFMENGGQQWVLIRALAYRTRKISDQASARLGNSSQVEPRFTKGSEVMVGETSAWGRANGSTRDRHQERHRHRTRGSHGEGRQEAPNRRP